MKKQTKNNFRGAGRVAVLAQPRKDRIKKMIDEGYPLTVIYERYRDELNISYEQFTRHVRKHLRSNPNENERNDFRPKQKDSAEAAPESGAEPVADEAEDLDEQFKKEADEGDFF